MKSAERRPTSIKIDPDLWKQVQVACIERGTTQSEAIEGLLRGWLEEGGARIERRPHPFPDLSKDEDKALRALLRFLREAPEDDTFRVILTAFVRAWALRRS